MSGGSTGGAAIRGILFDKDGTLLEGLALKVR